MKLTDIVKKPYIAGTAIALSLPIIGAALEDTKKAADYAFFRGTGKETKLVNNSLGNRLEEMLGSGAAYSEERSDLINEGTRLQNQQKYPESIELFRKSIELEPNHPVGYINASASYSVWAESIQKMKPSESKDLYNLSNKYANIALEKLKDNKSGLSSQDIDKLFGLVYEVLGFDSKLTGDKEKAITYFEKSLLYRPNEFIQNELDQLLKPKS